MSASSPVAIIERFDRTPTEPGALHFRTDHDGFPGRDRCSTYLNLADVIREQAASPYTELKELFQRVAFTILVSNADDHLKTTASFMLWLTAAMPSPRSMSIQLPNA